MVEVVSGWSRTVALRLGERKEKYSAMDSLKAQAIIQSIKKYDTLGQQVISQARRRVLHGESVPNDEKLFSVFEPHTELLKRGKAGKPIEFGHMIQIQQVENKFIASYTVFEKKPVEHQLLTLAVERHKTLFGRYPEEMSADKGYYESMEALETLERMIPVVSISKKGKRTAEELEREQEPLFKLAQRFRAGVEGSISFLKRMLRLLRCFNKGWEHFVATVGQTIFAHNLTVLSRC
jgi:IS5 family transposase